MKSFFAILLFVMCLCSCRSAIEGSDTTGKTELARDVAVRKAEELFGWKKVHVDYCELSNGFWSVMVSKIPEVPGGFVIFKVTNEGKVVGWKGGS